ncbi:MAG: hypothetical protein OZ928_09140 [Polyangiaceae bacterium]|nr:hypothetical protein [Polyangiaceae bacterium]
MLRRFSVLAMAGWLGACSLIAGLDEDYRGPGTAASGGASSGGGAGTGGGAGSGGNGPGGAPGTGGTSGASGTGGTSGASGTGGAGGQDAGSGGGAGSGGNGPGGASGTGGTGGASGTGGTGGASGTGGTGGASGTGGTGGAGGALNEWVNDVGKLCRSDEDCSLSGIPGGTCDGSKRCTRPCNDHDDCGCPSGTTDDDLRVGYCVAACVGPRSGSAGWCRRVCADPERPCLPVDQCTKYDLGGYGFCSPRPPP